MQDRSPHLTYKSKDNSYKCVHISEGFQCYTHWTTKPVISVHFSKIYASSESGINNISIDVWFVMIGQYLKIWNLRVQKNLNIEKSIFKVVQIKFLNAYY